MALVCLLFIVDGNSIQCLETNSNMLKIWSKEYCVLSSYSVPTVLYTEVLKRKIQYFAIIRVFIISQEWAFEYMHYYM